MKMERSTGISLNDAKEICKIHSNPQKSAEISVNDSEKHERGVQRFMKMYRDLP